MMYDIPYDDWANYIASLMPGKKTVIEYACGTGNLTLGLLEYGLEITAVDYSEEMLDNAQSKIQSHAKQANFVCADMVGFRRDKLSDAAVCACDGVNYILEKEDLTTFFTNVYNNLKEDGIFLFDISSHYKLEHILGDNFFYDDGENETLFWKNTYHPASKRLDLEITMFISTSPNTYERFDEIQYQRAWEQNEIAHALDISGFKRCDVFSFLTEFPPSFDTQRIQFVATKGR